MESSTKILRRMLDERRVEWEDGGEGLTIIPVQDGVPRAWTVNTWPSGKDMGDCLWVQNRHPLTPEQAVEATLGRGTCHADETETIYANHYDNPNGFTNYHIHVMECSACGRTYEHVFGDYEYCPHCGRRLEVTDG